MTGTATVTQAAIEVNALHSRSRPRHKQFRTNVSASREAHMARKQQQFGHPNPTRRCGWCTCSKDQHPRERCPSKNGKCRRCSKLGHYEAVCRSSSAGTTSTLNEVDGAAFLGAVNFGSVWTECVHVNGVPLSMKVNTGADVTSISELEYRRTLQSVPKLQRPDRVLIGPNRKGLPVLGQRILKHINSMPTHERTDLSVFESFPAIFSGHGQFKGQPHQIHLQDDTISFTLTMPR